MSSPARFLVGPLDDPTFIDRMAADRVAAGRWVVFPAACPNYNAAAAWFEPGQEPSAILWWPGYASTPSWLATAPVPVIALADDADLLWHQYREQLPLADLVLTDVPSADHLRRAGFENVRIANLHGLNGQTAVEREQPENARDIDVLFVGGTDPAIDKERLPWLGRLARLSERCRVVIAPNAEGPDVRVVLKRAKICVNVSRRGECNALAMEAAALGAVLFQEANNAELPVYLNAATDFVSYTEEDLEERIERYLGDEAERRRMTQRARRRTILFAALVEMAAGVGGSGWPLIHKRAEARRVRASSLSLSARVWQRVNLTGPNSDQLLLHDLRQEDNAHAIALLSSSPKEAEPHLRRAAEINRISALGLATVLIDSGRTDEAIAVLRKTIDSLDTHAQLSESERTTCPYPTRFDHLRVGWERAGWNHPDDAHSENAAKIKLLLCRAYSLLAEMTGDIGAFHSAADACPEIPTVRAALGCALARNGQFDQAALHLRFAVERNPFDEPAAGALFNVLTELGEHAEAERVRRDRLLLARAMSNVENGTPPFRMVSRGRQPAGPVARSLDPVERPSLPPAAGVQVESLQALVAKLMPQRVLDVGSGSMASRLVPWIGERAIVFALHRMNQDPSHTRDFSNTLHTESELARGAIFSVQTDPRSFQFENLKPLDLACIDVSGNPETVLQEALSVHAVLRPGGCLLFYSDDAAGANAVIGRSLGLPEPVHRLDRTPIWYLFKGEGVGANAGPDLPRIAIAWDGEFRPAHSLAAVNRALCGELAARGQLVSLLESPARTPANSQVPLSESLTDCIGREIVASVTVRHRWPPDFSAPASGALVLMQPWEFGRVPRDWVRSILESVDEVWVNSRSTQRAYLASGVPSGRVHVIPNGVDLDRFRPELPAFDLATKKPVKFLAVGGTIPRKGFDVLLSAYRRAFTRADNVCLVVKDFGAGAFYRGQTSEDLIAAHQADPDAPEIEYLTCDLSESDLARLYSTCDVFVSAYRGEGFGLPILEAMACGKPVIVTSGGPSDEFVPPSAGWRIPARVTYFPEDRVGGLETAGRPWWLEPDTEALTPILRTAATNSVERRRRGAAARQAALGWSWARAASVVEDRARQLRNKTPIRSQRPAVTLAPRGLQGSNGRSVASDDSNQALFVPHFVVANGITSISAIARGKPRVSLTMIVKNEEHNISACLTTVRDLVDEIVIVDTGSSDRTREIAESFGAKVSEFAWVDSFSAARNVALERATGDWAFWMDADDRLDKENAGKLGKLFGSLGYENGAYVMKCVCVADSPGGTATAVDHVRLFRTDPHHRWKYRVHEQILPALRQTGTDVRWSDVAVHHVGYIDAALRKRKLERDLRLLELEKTEQPNDPFTLFNLGSVYNEFGDSAAAVVALDASLAGSNPKDSIVRKLYAMLAQCHRRFGDPTNALSLCRAGREHYPDDAELLFIESNILKENKDAKGAEVLMLRLIHGQEGEHFGSVDTGLRGYKARHNLACLYFENHRYTEAESQWRAALVDEPNFLPAHLGLGELCLRKRNWPGVDRVVTDLRGQGLIGEAEAESLLGRSLTTRGEYVRAREVLERAVARFPSSVSVRSAYSYLLLEGRYDPIEAEAALRDVLKLDPQNDQAKRNLEALYRNTGRWVEGILDS